MKKSVKILAGITAFVLIGGILWFASGILGNPISKVLANNTAKKYIDKNYSHMNLNISEVSYNFLLYDLLIHFHKYHYIEILVY